MSNAIPSGSFKRLSSSQISRLLGVEAGAPESWGEADLAAMFRHQMDASLQFDLSSLPANEAQAGAVGTTLDRAAAGRLQTFRDLLHHPQPPKDLLSLAKDFFKQRAAEFAKGSPDWQLAYCFYLLTILVAQARGQSISSLGRPELLEAVRWALGQSWVEQATREQFEAARARLES